MGHYKIVMDKLRRSQGLSLPKDKESLRKIVEVLFPTGEPSASLPNQEHKKAGEPLKLKAKASRLYPGKSPGLDGITNEVVRLIAKENAQMLISVFNKCLEEVIFLDRWKRQKLVLIPKNTQATAVDPSSFTSLEMIDTTAKLFESFIINRIEEVCEEEDNEGGNPQPSSASARDCPTHHALKKVKEVVSEAFHELPSMGGFCAIIALDIKNAFNSVS